MGTSNSSMNCSSVVDQHEEKERTVTIECEWLIWVLDYLLLVQILELLILSANWSVSGFIGPGVEEIHDSCYAVLPLAMQVAFGSNVATWLECQFIIDSYKCINKFTVYKTRICNVKSEEPCTIYWKREGDDLLLSKAVCILPAIPGKQGEGKEDQRSGFSL